MGFWDVTMTTYIISTDDVRLWGSIGIQRRRFRVRPWIVITITKHFHTKKSNYY